MGFLVSSAFGTPEPAFPDGIAAILAERVGPVSLTGQRDPCGAPPNGDCGDDESVEGERDGPGESSPWSGEHPEQPWVHSFTSLRVDQRTVGEESARAGTRSS